MTVNGGICENVDSITVVVVPGPVADAGPDATINFGESTPLFGTGGGSYVWTPDASLSNPFVPSPTAAPDVTTIYYLTVSDGTCESTDSVTVFVLFEPLLVVPNAFSPNADGTNDVFNVIALQISELLKFKIFNRWGEVIFESTSLNAGWDGTYKGEPQEIGTYIYLIEALDLNGEKIFQKGNVTLIR